MSGPGHRVRGVRGVLGAGAVIAVIAVIVGIAIAPPALGVDDGCPLDSEALLGVWEATGDDRLVQLTPSTVGFTYRGRVEQLAPVVSCAEGRVVTCSYGNASTRTFELDGDELTITATGVGPQGPTERRRVYRRADAETAAIFDLAPLDILAPRELDPERRAALVAELAERREEDQRVREGSWEDLDAQEMMRVDADNTRWLKETIAEVGWIDAERFGAEAAEAAFLIVQHSGDLPLMKAALPLVREAGRLGEYALMADRIRLRTGEPQIYGSQVVSSSTGEQGLAPVEDLETLDERRAEMGLPPIAEYLARFDIDTVRVLDCSGAVEDTEEDTEEAAGDEAADG